MSGISILRIMIYIAQELEEDYGFDRKTAKKLVKESNIFEIFKTNKFASHESTGTWTDMIYKNYINA